MSRFYKRIIIQKVSSFFFLLFLNHVNAQDFKLAGINYAHYPNAAIKNNSDELEASFHEFGAFVNFPKKFKNDKTVLINGVGYGFVETTMYNFQMFQTSDYRKKLQIFYYQLMFIHKWNEKWSLLVYLKPTIASDFDQKLSADDFIFQGAVIATRTMNDNFKIGTGVANSSRWGRPIVVPLVNIHYKNNKHIFNALLPLILKYTYSLFHEERLKLGVQYALNGANFNVSTSHLQQSNAFDIDKINYSRANIGALANYQLTKLLRLEAFGGITMQRIFRLVDSDDNVADFDSQVAPFFSIGILMVSPWKNK